MSPSWTTWVITKSAAGSTRGILSAYIRLSFQSVFPSSLDRAHRLAAFAEIVEVLVGDHFGFDEPPLEIAVDSASSLRCQTPSWNSPASNFLLASYAQVSTGAHQGVSGRSVCRPVK